MSGAVREAWRRLRARRARTALAAVGIAAAAAMLGTAVTVGYDLGTGFDRSANRADLPDVIAHFSPKSTALLDSRLRGLPDLAARSYREEFHGVPLRSGGRESLKGVALTVAGRRGYAVVAGHDVHGAGEVAVDRGLADDWGLRIGDRIDVGALPGVRIVGLVVSPDNVAFPLTSVPHVYLARDWIDGGVAPGRRRVNVALLWARDPGQLDAMLTQARAISYGLQDLRFLTRSGIRAIVDEAAGIVVALLAAFSLVALAAAGVMLAASSSAEVQRRLQSIGVERAVGLSRRGIAGRTALEAALVALPAGALGLAAGGLAAGRASDRLLLTLNQVPAGSTTTWLLGAALFAVVTVVTGAAAWPAWRAAGRPPLELLRGAELRRAPRRSSLPGAFAGLGARLAVARRGRAVATTIVLGTSAAVVLLMLALASLVLRLEHDPVSVGKRYQLTAALPPSEAASVRRVPGVAAAAPRYTVRAADSFDLSQSFQVIAIPGDHTVLEAPPLASGRRLRGDGEAEVGTGLADAVGLGPGSTLAMQVPSGREVRFRVAGTVRALPDNGRVVYVRPARLLAAEPDAASSIAVRLAPGASRSAVQGRLSSGGSPSKPVSAATSRNRGFLDVIANLLRIVAGVDAAICLYALVQSLALTARERRSAVALLRACGAGPSEVAVLLAGAAAAVAVPAALLGVLVERFALAPAVAGTARGYLELPLAAGAGQIALVAVGLLAIVAVAAALVAWRLTGEPIVAGLRSE